MFNRWRCRSAHYFRVGLILNQSRPGWVIRFHIPRDRHVLPTELLFDIGLLLRFGTSCVPFALGRSTVPRLFIIQFLCRL